VISYTIKQISSQEATKMVVENHYLHRRASTMFAYGLFDGEEMLGCIIYGKPASPSLCVGVCGPEESSKVLELTRLWIADGTPKNTESYLIGRSLRLLPEEKDIIVSYAEIDAGHIGVVYQATNWIYTGMSDRHVEWRLDGKSGTHSRHLFDEHGGVNGAKAFYGDRLERHERPRKHRYVYFRASSKTRSKELLNKLRYKVQPYPKRELSNEEIFTGVPKQN
jgi:hypothetical protein